MIRYFAIIGLLLFSTEAISAKIKLPLPPKGQELSYSCTGSVNSLVTRIIDSDEKTGLSTALITQKGKQNQIVLKKKNYWQTLSITALERTNQQQIKKVYEVKSSTFPKSGNELEAGKSYTAELDAGEKDPSSPMSTTITIAKDPMDYNSKTLGAVKVYKIEETANLKTGKVEYFMYYHPETSSILYSEWSFKGKPVGKCTLVK